MHRLIEFIKRIYVVLLFVLLEGIALMQYAQSSPYTEAKILSRTTAVGGAVSGAVTGVGHFFTLPAENRKLTARIAELEQQLKHVRILDESEMSGDHVHVGSKVRIEANGKEYTYVISGATEADPFAGRISDESPVGKAVMGLKVGEKGEAILPNGSTVIYTVLEIGK